MRTSANTCQDRQTVSAIQFSNIYNILIQRRYNPLNILQVGIFFALQGERIGRAIIGMNFSTACEKFLSHTKEAYDKYEKQKIPFAAVKIYITGSWRYRAGVADMVWKNFRSEKDVILKSENNYAILMKNTSLEAAEAATNRLGMKLYHLTYDSDNLEKNLQFCASACIYGVSEETKKLHFRYLDFINPFYAKRESELWPPNVREYLKWLQPLKIRTYKPISIKV